jgi:hypothetical protein
MHQAREVVQFSVKGKQQRTKTRVTIITDNEMKIIFDS